MAFKPASATRVLVGSLNYTAYATKVQTGITVAMLDYTTLANTAKVFGPGQDTSTISIDMLLDTDTTTGGQWSAGTGWKASTSMPITHAPSGTAVGSECLMARGLLTQFAPKSQVADRVLATLAAQTDGATDPGVFLEDLTAVTVDGNGTARDNGAATSNGGIAFLHTTAFSGLTSDVITIEHSVDGSTSWATLVTFSTVTSLATGYDAQVVAPATTVRRYLRVVDDVTGTGSITRAVTFARR